MLEQHQIRHLGMNKRSHIEWLHIMNQSKYNSYECDTYNEGPLVDLIENRVAHLLNKPEALFFNKGTTCQLAALKTICEYKDNSVIAIHPQSHIAIDEDDAYRHITQLEAMSLGSHNTPINHSDLLDLNTIPAVLVIEMPLRRAGFKLADWGELEAIRAWCNENHVHLHMDGARLWESAPFYKQEVSAICALFDSIYISLYKGIGGLSGALLAGDKDLIDATKPWRNRLGSQMWSNFPALLTGLEGIDKQLPLISQCVERAHQIANKLSDLKQLIVETPQTNGFLIHTQGEADNLNHTMKSLKKLYQLSPCKPWQQGEHGRATAEIQVGSDHAEISDKELSDFFTALLNA